MSTPRDPADRYPERPDAAAGDTTAMPTADRSDARHVAVDRDGDGVDDRREVADRPSSTVTATASTTVARRFVDRDRDGVDDRREAADPVADRREVVAREREAFGGVKVGAAFFGWLTAFGTATLLTALLAATGAALGLGAEDVEAAADQVGLAAGTVGWIGAIALLVILFLAYYCGGYVAGRMARFNGMVQGLAVWVWALVIAIVVALLGVVVGSQYDVFADLNIFPRIPLSEGDLTLAGIVTAVVVALASLGGAILGGKAGTHYHRKVDRAGFGG